MKWRLNAVIRLVGTEVRLPDLRQEEAQELSNALLDAAVRITKRRLVDTDLDGELVVDCDAENLTA